MAKTFHKRIVYKALKNKAFGFSKKDRKQIKYIFKQGDVCTVSNTEDGGWMYACFRKCWINYKDEFGGRCWVRTGTYLVDENGKKYDMNHKPITGNGGSQDENNSSSGSSSSDVPIATGGIVEDPITRSKSYKKKPNGKAPEWIVIHNSYEFNTAKEIKDFFQNGANGNNTSAHYCVDPTTVLHSLDEMQYVAFHAGKPKADKPAVKKGAKNETSIGIEIADGAECDIDASIEMGIECCRYLMQKYNLGIDRVIKHQDISGKGCPWYMISGNNPDAPPGNNGHGKGDDARWTRFKNECETRNKNNIPLAFSTSLGAGAAGQQGWGSDDLPNFDNRENWEWTEKWDGVTFSFIPPRNSCSVKDQEDYFELNKYEQKYNYVCDAETFEEQTNPNYICFSMEDNDRNTYIQNALWGSNKAIKNTVSVGVFIDPKSEKFEDMQIKLIQNIGQIMYKLDMDANDLWREFDLNRAASPFMYLDRKKWKLFLDEINKQLEWRREKYGEHPEIVPTPVGPPPKQMQQQGSTGTPGYIETGVNICVEYSAYCPFDNGDPLSGDPVDSKGNPLSPGMKVLSVPKDPSNGLWGKRAMIYGTGDPAVDGMVYEIKDNGPNMVIKSDSTWRCDIIKDTSAECDAFGHKKGYLRIETPELKYKYKLADKTPEEDGFNQPPTSGGITLPATPVTKDKKPSEPDKPTEPETPEEPGDDGITVDPEETNRDITSPEHYFEIEEIEDDCPKPSVIITQKEFNELMDNYSDSRMIDIYAMKHEPWDKDLEHIREATITNDDRMEAMTKKLETNNENTFHYNVLEAAPGGSSAGSHCVNPSAELNILAKPDPVNVDPIYPDLTIIPNYSTADYNSTAQNRVPLYMMDEASVGDDATTEGQFAYDYSLLKDKKKESKGKPVNYYDPYVYDDRVHDLELHHPKVKIDEIELKLYDCNHPGCPVSQPMAKSISAMAEAHLTQSKKIEQRLVRIENTVAWLVRNFGRLGARMNINCVYWGGFDTFGKYRVIRCLKDDRVEEGCTVTIDQCLSCTRFEPIIGQIYDILDENGMNGSAILDDMQMSYMDLNTMESLNSIHKRNVSPKYANVKTDGEDKFESLITKWHDLDLEIYKKKLEQLKEERSKELEEVNKKYEEEKAKLEKEEQEKADLLGTNKNETIQTTKASRTKPEENDENSNVSSDDNYTGDSDIKEETKEDINKEIITQLIAKHQKPNMPYGFDKDLDEIKEEDYLFKMDWTPMDLNLQEPDIKPYPNEHIKSKYKIQGGDKGEEETGVLKPESENKEEDKDNESSNSKKALSYARDKKPEGDVEGDGSTPESENEEVDTKPEDHKPWDPDMDFESDLKYDKETNEKLQAGEWVDTREIADTTELNKYTSEDFYYEGFNVNRGGSSGMGGGAECRRKIVEMALKIVEDHKNGKACYTQANRTNDYDKPNIGSGNGLSGVPGYDCSSFVSCCYRYAGLTEVCDKNSDGINSCCSKSFRERLTMDNLDIAQAGDIIWRSGHVMIYIGNGEIAHASTGKKPVPDGIKVNKIDGQLSKHECYVERPADLIAADQMASAVGSGSGEACSSVVTKNGTVSCVWKFTGAVCTNYTDSGHCSDGTSTVGGNVVAAHNFRFGSQIYIPALDGKGGGGMAGDMNLGPKNNGMFRVADNGGPYFDFDVHSAKGTISKGNYDVYVISYGKGPLSWSFSDAIRDAKKRGNFHPDAWKSLIDRNPQTLRFTAFKQEDLKLNINDPLGSV